MNRRDAAQGCETEVQRGPGVGAQLRHQGHRLVIGIGDDPQPVGAIQLTGLLGNVRCGEEQAVEHFHRRVGSLGDDLAVAFLFESVDQYPVVTGHGLDFLDAHFVQLLQRGRRLQTLEHPPQIRLVAGDIARLEILDMNLQLQDQHPFMAMQQAFERRAVDVETQGWDVEEGGLLQRFTYGFGVCVADEALQRAPDQRLRLSRQ
ncbi:hypothetical protein D3C73_1040420 [compost metagenome]